ncbi:unnamed protein product, partial [Ectocarpus fasciculatus]
VLPIAFNFQSARAHCHWFSSPYNILFRVDLSCSSSFVRNMQPAVDIVHPWPDHSCRCFLAVKTSQGSGPRQRSSYVSYASAGCSPIQFVRYHVPVICISRRVRDPHP